MSSSGLLRHVALVRTDVSEELSASIIRVTRIGELRSSKTSVLIRAVQQNIPEDNILHSRHHENLKYYLVELLEQASSPVCKKCKCYIAPLVML
jgi:hypothetical protein